MASEDRCPFAAKEFQRYGGNTTCLCVTRESPQQASLSLMQEPAFEIWERTLVARHYKQEIINIYFTHFHMDHMQGFPIFRTGL